MDSRSSKPAHTLDLRQLVDVAAAAAAKGSKTAEDRLNPMIRWLIPFYCPKPEEVYVAHALSELGVNLTDHAACSAK